MSGRPWSVEFHSGCKQWVDGLERDDAESLLAAIRVLRDMGPALGRPLVDTIKGSRHKNMKELRPGSVGRSEVRVLFAFDVERRAILLVGGDKCGNWKGWYEANVPVADDRLEEHNFGLVAKPSSAAGAGHSAKNGNVRRGRRR